MPYKIIFSDNALSELERLDKTAQKRIIKKLKTIGNNPSRGMSQLSGRKELKIRVGDYRILAIISHSEETILIIAMGHRKDVYKKN